MAAHFCSMTRALQFGSSCLTAGAAAPVLNLMLTSYCMPLGVCMTTCCQWQAIRGAIRVAAAPWVPLHASSASPPATFGWPPMATTSSAPNTLPTAAHNAKQCLQLWQTVLPRTSWPSRRCNTLTSATADKPPGGPQHTPASFAGPLLRAVTLNSASLGGLHAVAPQAGQLLQP